jgi:predicted transposase YdaD
MTKVGRIIERERIEYGNQKMKENSINTAKILLARDVDILTIMEATGLTEQEILSLQDEMAVV